MDNIPTTFYVVVGVLIVANFASLITILTFIFKAGMFVSDTKAGITKATESAIRAHKRIDKVEEKI